MLEEIYRWIQNISVYLIVMAAVMHAIPGKDYGKYIRFFSGLVLILMLSSPLLRLAEWKEHSGHCTKEKSMRWNAGRSSGRRNSMSSPGFLIFSTMTKMKG